METGRGILVVGETDELARINRITEQIIGSAIAVHQALGPGLLRSAYEQCLRRDQQDTAQGQRPGRMRAVSLRPSAGLGHSASRKTLEAPGFYS